MKTAVIMYRDLNGVKVRQNHKTGLFNANDLMELYNNTFQKEIDVHAYLRSKQFKDFKKEVIKDILQNTQKIPILNNGETITFVDLDTEKQLCDIKKGKNGGTWLHPYLFIDFAMWLNPKFKLTCIKWLNDRLIQTRDECGESFKEINKALAEIKPNSPPFVYSNEADMINKLVFGTTKSGQRNLATEQQLILLKTLQKADVQLIKENKDFFERYQSLRRLKQLL